MKILLIDNYDSFTYNLVHYIEGMGVSVFVYTNDNIPFHELDQYDKIVLSPGPGLPVNAVGIMTLINEVDNKIPILGVCLGFQAIIEHLGGELYNQKVVKHGIKEKCRVENNSTLFRNLPATFDVGLYHSWAAKKVGFPKNLIITAYSYSNVIMAFENKEKTLFGVQFHPESILTSNGYDILRNFIFIS